MGSTAIPATSKEQRLRRIEQTHRALRSAIAALPRDRFAETLSAGWSLNEVVAHLAAWEETVPPRVQAVLDTGKDPKLYDDVDAFNARVAAQAKGKTPDELLTRWTAAHERAIATLRDLEDDAPQLAYDIVGWNTDGHYPDHFADIGAAIRDANDVMTLVHANWIAFRGAIGAIGLRKLEERTSSGWTYKDLVAHAAAWEGWTAWRLQTFRESGEARRYPGIEDADAANAEVVERTRGRDAREIIAELDGAHARILDEIKQLTSAQLHENDDWAITIIAGNTYGHYAEHFDEVFAAVPRLTAELLDRMREGWRSFRTVLGRVGLTQLGEATPAGWTHKAMLSHLAYWMEQIPGELANRLAGRRSALPDVDAENAREASAAGERSSHDVVKRLDAAYHTVVETVKALPPDRDVPFLAVRLIVGDTYGHFPEHQAELESALPRTADAMLARLDEAWRRFRGAIRERGRTGMSATTPAGWSYRDLCAHAAAWLQEATRELETGERPSWSKHAIQAFNDRAVEAHRLVGAEAMLDELDTSLRRLRGAIATLTPEQLADGKTFDVAAWCSYLHWEEHYEELGITL